MKKIIRKRKNGVIIFDLDMTLVDTSSLQSLRDKRKWGKIKNNLDKTTAFPGIKALINRLSLYFDCGVVTSSPRDYAESVLHYHDIDLPVIIAYHDTQMHKPHPEPFIAAFKRFGIVPDTFDDDNGSYRLIIVGDHENDMIAGNLAAPQALLVGVTWGGNTSANLLSAAPMVSVFYTPEEFSDAIFIEYTDFNPFMSHITAANYIHSSDNGCPKFVDRMISLINYFPTRFSNHDALCMALLKFKSGEMGIIQKWSKVSAEILHGLNPDEIYRVLSHGEKKVSQSSKKPLDHLCNYIADSMKNTCSYVPESLSKKRVCREVKYLSVSEKKKELKGLYKYKEIPDWRGQTVKMKHILLVDDIVTSGTTASRIAKLIKKSHPDVTITLFTLGKTTNPDFSGVNDNSHFDKSLILE
jgi:phosphoglycolate phosphatase-like HAD superfamily hydrolase